MIDPRAITKAKSRLRVVQRAVANMQTCRDFDTFTDLWYTFLTAGENLYTALKKGSKSPQDKQWWFSEKGNERRNDPLLQYVFQARHDDQHGLELLAKHVLESTGYGRREGGSQPLLINTLPDGRLLIQSTDGTPVNVEHTSAHIELKPVTGRGDVIYNTPTLHISQTVDGRYPGPVARLASAYLATLVSEAERRA